jgi:DNA-binding NarL/FixJ family response regulator
MADIDKEVERIEQGDAWEESDEVVPVEVKRPLDKVIPVRLPSDKWEQIRQEARELGVGPTTLARMWILERLSSRTISPHETARVFKFFLESALQERLVSPLTLRETEILNYLAQGNSIKQIAYSLVISEQTIKSDLLEILRKLGAKDERSNDAKVKQQRA